MASPNRKIRVEEAVNLLVPSARISAWNRKVLDELDLAERDGGRILFELELLQILALHFAIVHAFEDAPKQREALVHAYYHYWWVHSLEVGQDYLEGLDRRLVVYGEVVLSSGDLETELAVGQAFAQLCATGHAVDTAFLIALGRRVFGTIFVEASRFLSSIELDLSGRWPRRN